MKINVAQLVLLTCLMFCTVVQTKDTDFTQQIFIRAENNLTSIKDNISTYINNVEVHQGSLLIKADRLEANASAGKGKEVFIATGNPATYSQLLEGNLPVTAKALEIRYDLASRILTLTGNAELTQSGSLVQGAIIRYDIEKQELSAESGEQNRVITIFTPEGRNTP